MGLSTYFCHNYQHQAGNGPRMLKGKTPIRQDRTQNDRTGPLMWALTIRSLLGRRMLKMNAASEMGMVLVAGHNRGSCQMVAQWLLDVGGPIAAVRHPDAIPASCEEADTIIFVIDSRQDIGLVGAYVGGTPSRVTSVLAVLVEPSWPLLIESIQLPVDAVVVLPVSGELLLRVLEEIRRPTSAPRPIAILPAEVLEGLSGDPVGGGKEDTAPPPAVLLTPREREILELLDRDFSNEEIARILVISPHTVKRHLEHLFSKLSVRSRHEAVRLAHRHGLLKTRQTDKTPPEGISFPADAMGWQPSLPAPTTASRRATSRWCEA
jgi:DNA-binding NarL/FixJ family response regulator